MTESRTQPRVAVVTGASSGIGLEAARSLASQGWRVLCLGRSPERCQQAREILEASAGAPDRVDMLRVDLAELADTAGAATELAKRTDRIDVLLNNAGGPARDRKLTSEGNEYTFAGNHLGHFLLTRLLLPLLRVAAAEGPRRSTRIINVSSAAHEVCRDGLDWDDLQSLEGFQSTPAYCRAKLANILFTRELARRLDDDGIAVHAMHPGMVNSNFASHADDGMQSYLRANEDRGLSPRDAADGLVWLATAPEPASSSGGYWFLRDPIEPSAAAQDEAAARRLWEESERLIAPLAA